MPWVFRVRLMRPKLGTFHGGPFPSWVTEWPVFFWRNQDHTCNILFCYFTTDCWSIVRIFPSSTPIFLVYSQPKICFFFRTGNLQKYFLTNPRAYSAPIKKSCKQSHDVRWWHPNRRLFIEGGLGFPFVFMALESELVETWFFEPN